MNTTKVKVKALRVIDFGPKTIILIVNEDHCKKVELYLTEIFDVLDKDVPKDDYQIHYTHGNKIMSAQSENILLTGNIFDKIPPSFYSTLDKLIYKVEVKTEKVYDTPRYSFKCFAGLDWNKSGENELIIHENMSSTWECLKGAISNISDFIIIITI